MSSCPALKSPFHHCSLLQLQEKSYDARLRAACIQILGYVICLSNVFNNVSFVFPHEAKVQAKLTNFGDVCYPAVWVYC
jgi:hypothetical protein